MPRFRYLDCANPLKETPEMNAFHRKLRMPLVLATLLMGLATVSAVAATSTALKPFTATYSANYLGLHGTATMTLAAQDSGRWTYSLDIDSAIAKLGQQTVFDTKDGHWRPLSGTDTSSLLIKKNKKQAIYDWSAREARWSGDVKDSRTGPVALQSGDLDALLINLAIPRDVAAGKPLDYRLVDNGRAKPLRYEIAGKENIEIGGKSQSATKVMRTDGDKQTVLWVVDGIPVPARLLQRKNGKDEFDLRLQSIR